MRPFLTKAAKKEVVALEIMVSDGDDGVGYYALPGDTPSTIEIPFYLKPGTYTLDIILRFKDRCEQFYKSTLRVTNEVFDRAPDQHPKEGIKLKMPKVYD